MSTEATARLNLPLLAPGQAQKELWHNEALAGLDIAVQASVRGVDLNDAPGDPGEGDCWVVGSAPAGVWADHPGAIAGWTAGGWRFVEPREGVAVWDAAGTAVMRYIGGRWTMGAIKAEALVVSGRQVVGPQQPPVAEPQGGAVIDGEARAALAAVLAALRMHGLIGA